VAPFPARKGAVGVRSDTSASRLSVSRLFEWRPPHRAAVALAVAAGVPEPVGVLVGPGDALATGVPVPGVVVFAGVPVAGVVVFAGVPVAVVVAFDAAGEIVGEPGLGVTVAGTGVALAGFGAAVGGAGVAVAGAAVGGTGVGVTTGVFVAAGAVLVAVTAGVGVAGGGALVGEATGVGVARASGGATTTLRAKPRPIGPPPTFSVAATVRLPVSIAITVPSPRFAT
jgi:hypothetical protein